MKSFKIIALILAGMFVVHSCDEKDIDLSNPNVLTEDSFFKSSNDLSTAVNAVYTYLQTAGLYGRYAYYINDNLSHENVALGNLEADKAQMIAYTFDASNPGFQSYWNAAYQGIARANFVIDANVENVSEQEINARKGEAKFLRALYYFMLTTKFGDIPLVLQVATNPDGFPRSPQADVYNAILSDLNDAIATLPAKGSEELGRATSGAAIALKGKVQLFTEDYSGAKTTLESLTGYSLVDDYNLNSIEVGEFNDESIFEVIFESSFGQGSSWSQNGRGVDEVTFRAQEYSGWFNVGPSDEFVAMYEDGDPRKTLTFYAPNQSYGPNCDASIVNTRPTFIWQKFQNLSSACGPEPTFFSGINARVLRYGDVLLMLAEIENELGNSAAAIDYLNQIRDRVGMPNYGTPEMDMAGYPVGNKQQIFEALVHERAVELGGEQARYDDIRRWGIIDQVITEFVSGKHELLPIPQTEIDANSSISQSDQNPGY